MTSKKEVVPWKCHICHEEFDTPSGGMCSRCNRSTCRAHLHQIGRRMKLESKWVCNDCLTHEEKTVKKGKWTLKLFNLSLKRTLKKPRIA